MAVSVLCGGPDALLVVVVAPDIASANTAVAGGPLLLLLLPETVSVAATNAAATGRTAANAAVADGPAPIAA